MAYSSAPKPCTTTQISLTSTPIHQVPASHDLSPSPSGLWNGPHWHSLAPWHISQGRTSDLQGPLLSQETTFRRCLCHQVYVCENRQTDGSGWTSTATLPSEQACLPSLHSMCVPDSQQGLPTLSLSLNTGVVQPQLPIRAKMYHGASMAGPCSGPNHPNLEVGEADSPMLS